MTKGKGKNLPTSDGLPGRAGPRYAQTRKFLLSCEDARTERGYFEGLRKHFKYMFLLDFVAHDGKTAPVQVLKRMQERQKTDFARFDEFWLVVDTDQRPDHMFGALHQWAQAGEGNFVAISNPMFEYWLILHYEDGRSDSAKSCKTCKSYFANCSGGKRSRGLPETLFSNVEIAMDRSAGILMGVADDIPHFNGWTQVHELVGRMLHNPPPEEQVS